MINIILNNGNIPVNLVVHSDGAIAYKVGDIDRSLVEFGNKMTLSVSPSTPVARVREELEMVMECLSPLFTAAGANIWNVHTTLYLPYLPYGRADRMFNKGCNIPLESFCNWLEGMSFSNVIVCDPHNPEAIVEYDINWTIVDQFQCFKTTVGQMHVNMSKYDAVVAPDKGAVGKAQKIADYYNLPLVVCTKERDVTTGKLSNPQVGGDVDGCKLLILDDLFDGGYTFYQLGMELKAQGAVSVDLYITHLIGAKGLDILVGAVDNVFCDQVVGNYLTKQYVFNFNDNYNLGE